MCENLLVNGCLLYERLVVFCSIPSKHSFHVSFHATGSWSLYSYNSLLSFFILYYTFFSWISKQTHTKRWPKSNKMKNQQMNARLATVWDCVEVLGTCLQEQWKWNLSNVQDRWHECSRQMTWVWFLHHDVLAADTMNTDDDGGRDCVVFVMMVCLF